MSTLELLDSVKHATVKALLPEHSGATFVRVVLEEIPSASACCPLLLSKHGETGTFYIGALMGFAPGELLVDRPDGRPAFKPMEWDRDGFFAVGEHIAFDCANPRFNQAGGESLFDQWAQPTPFLKAAQNALGRLMAASPQTDQFIAEMLAHGLIEPIDISLNFDDGERLRLEGLYTVSLDGIADLDDAALLKLLRNGHLQIAYLMRTSVHHIALMARRRNVSLAAV